MSKDRKTRAQHERDWRAMQGEWRGLWWLPGQRDRAVVGELRLNSAEFVLQLDGCLPREARAAPSSGDIGDLFEEVTEPVILGESRSGERFTLLNCDGYVAALPLEQGSSTWRLEVAILGDHLEKEPPRFEALRCEFDYLRDWAERTQVPYTIQVDDEQKLTGVGISADREVIGTAKLPNGTASLFVTPAFQVGSAKATIELKAHFEVALKKGLTWEEAVDGWVWPLRDLVSFATVRPNRTDGIRVRPVGSDGWVQLLLRLTDFDRPSRSDKRLVGPEFLFGVSALPSGFEPGLRKWFRVYERYASVFAPLLGVGYAPFIYSDQRFTAYAQAAEVLHRIAVGGTPIDPKTHKQRVKRVAEDITDPALQGWAKEVLRTSNHYRLRDRLWQLVQGLGELKDPLTRGDPEGFVGRIVKTRNYLAHRDKKTKGILEGAEQHYYGSALEWIIRTWLLSELGFGKKAARKRVAQNREYRSVVRNLGAL